MTEDMMKKQGKKNKQAGARFELIVRKDMTLKGWHLSKFQNNLETVKQDDGTYRVIGSHMIPSKHKFRGPGIPMAMGTGFPDFMCWIVNKEVQSGDVLSDKITYMMGIEVKSSGYLNQEEKAKCQWMLDNKVFHKIVIAKKTKVGRKIVPEYIDFVDYIKK